MREYFHHLEHLVLYSLVIWQIALAGWLILRYFIKNIPPMWIKRSEEALVGDYEAVSLKKKSLGVVDVDVQKSIFIDSLDEIEVKVDEIKRGKVKTQKNKLRELKK